MKNKFVQFILYGLVFLTTSTAFAQQVTVSGQVRDQGSGEPLPGVNVLVEGTTRGTTTDLEGNYSLAFEAPATLLFTMVGMEDQRFEINQSLQLNVQLAEESQVLGEVVVNGFQEVERKLFTGSAESISMDELDIRAEPDISRMLEGRVAGVTVDNVSGTFGTSPKIRIRGNTSINGNNQPLFVVDGVILEDLNNVDTEDFISGNANTLVSSSVANLNPNDIESFEILRDASATAIYGARAANGVIVITTKRGKSGDLRINYNGNFSAKIRPTYNQFDLLNSAEELSVHRELVEKGVIDITTAVAAENYGAVGKMFTLINNKEIPWGPGGTLNENFLNQYENANTDWFDVLFNNFALQQQHSLSFTTGSEKSNNYYSLSYLHDQGTSIADGVNRVTATARNTYFISDKFTFGLKTNGSYRQQDAPGTADRSFDPITGSFSRNFDINPYSYALNTARSIRPFDANGDREFFRRNFAPFNILEELELNFIDIRVLDISSQVDFDYRPVDDLIFKGVFQVRYASTLTEQVVHENSNQAEAYRADDTQFIQNANDFLFQDPNEPGLNPKVVLPVGGFNYQDESDLLNYFARVSGQYSKNIGEDHTLNFLGGAELRYSNRTERFTSGLGVVYESGGVVITDPNIVEFFNLQNVDIFTLDQFRDRFVGSFINGAYSYKSRYIINGTFRYDGSNQLGRSQQARWLPTWNVSGAWNLDQEPFMQNISFFDYLKLRATYGLSGNLPPESSAILNLVADVTVRPDDVEPLLFIQDLTNEELTWEKLKEFNVGVDIGFFEGRLTATLDYYRRQSFDLIDVVQTSGIGGQLFKVGNFADMEADGFEVTLNSVNMKTENFQWTTNFNIAYTYDRITRLDFGPRLADAIEQGGAAVLGGPRRGLFSTRFAGLNSQGIPTFFDENDEVVTNYDLQERDNLNATLVYEGPVEPRGAGGLTNTFTWKGFRLFTLISYKFDYKIRLNDAFRPTYNDIDALPGDLVNRWAVPGDENITDIPVILDAITNQTRGDLVNAYNLFNKSGLRVANGDYVRLKTVRLSYALPTSLVSKWRLSNMSVSIEGNNIAFLYRDSALNGQDPEFFSTGGVALPPPRTVTLSLNVGL